MSKVCVLPKDTKMFNDTLLVHYPDVSWNAVNHICTSPEFDMEDVGSDVKADYTPRLLVAYKLRMVEYVKRFFAKEGIDFDEFNGLAPTGINSYKAYEFSTMWLWTLMITIIEN